MADNEFVIKYSEFYKKFLEGFADSINLLAGVQDKFKDDYDKIKEFNHDPKAIEELIEKLSPEEQNMLLKLLLKSGSIGKKISNLFEMSADVQRGFAVELKTFAGEIDEDLKKIIDIMKKAKEAKKNE